MITIRLSTFAYLPPFSEITLRTDVDGWGNLDIGGNYREGCWVFELDDARYLNGFECKFVRNRTGWSNGGNFVIGGQDGVIHTFYLSEFGFGAPQAPVVELGQVQTRISDVQRPIPEDRIFDVIVIGSGMGGGVLSERLADNGAEVLVLEAGGIPLETHIANLPRPQAPGQFRKHVWERWFEYQVINFDQPQDPALNDYNGAQAFNLGGRSMFWGGFIPRMSSWELDFWPLHLKWDLEDRYFQLAEDLMGRSTAPATFYSREIHRLLREELPLYSHFDAPVAVRSNFVGANTISPGMYSTADLLLESARTAGNVGNAGLSIRTHHEVRSVAPGDPCVVSAIDRITGEERAFRGKFVVMSCGCLESSRLAARSGIGNEMVGQGVTDHPIAFTHFEIPPTSPLYDRFGNVKILSQPKEPRPGENRVRDPFNMLIELGADFNQGRFIDEEILDAAARKRSMLCEVVFLTNSELVQTNKLEFDAAKGFRPVAMVKNPGPPAAVRNRIQEITQSLLARFGATVLNTGEGDGGLGGVAHEVGSLRMEVADSNNIQKGAQQPLAGVVDENGKFLGQDFVYACDLSIFPTSPAANPSLTLTALAMRLGDRLLERLRGNQII